MPDSERSTSVANRLLGALPAETYQRLRARLSRIVLSPRQVLHERNLPVRAVYFPNNSLVSLVTRFEDGFQLQTGLVGCDGMTGLGLAAGVDHAITDAVVQAPGDAFTLEAAEFRRALDAFPELHRIVLAYADSARAHALQWAACNGHHNLEQRLARWLLMMDDRTQGTNLPITQENMAMMLCVHRPSVTVVAGRLQRAGVIRYASGHLTITNRPGLLELACECYGTMQRRYPLSCK